MIANGTRVAFKFQPGFGTVTQYVEGEGIVEDYGFSVRTGREDTYVIRVEDGSTMHVLRWNVRKV